MRTIACRRTATILLFVLSVAQLTCTIHARLWHRRGKKGGAKHGKKQKSKNSHIVGGIFNKGKKGTTPKGIKHTHQIGPHVANSNDVHVVADRTYLKRPSTVITPAPPGQSLAKVAAYYYPWWGDDFHRGALYMRGVLEPPMLPELGKYNDTEPAVIDQHLTWSRQANIQVWIASWWGPDKREDVTLRDVILPHPNLGDMEISLIYETRNRVKETEEDSGVFDFSNVIPDIEHIADNYFGHPNFLRIGGRPVLFMYVSRFYSNRDALGELVVLMRQAAASRGYNIFVVGDEIWRDAPEGAYEPFDILDGVTNYDVYGNLQTQDDTYARQGRIDLYNSRQQAWRTACQGKCAFFPSLSPGLNKRGKITPLSRKLDESAAYGSLFQAMATNAVSLVDEAADNIIVVTSFNEWHEDTQIEPTAEGIPTDLPLNVTYGLSYEPYGDLYLNILRDSTTA